MIKTGGFDRPSPSMEISSMKFIKPFRGALKGEAFPREYKAGDDCPPELERAARAAGALAPEKKPTTKNKSDD